MSRIAIVTDTDASLPKEIAAQYGIRQVPINIHFGEESFQSGVDLDDAGAFERIAREGRLPTTSAPSPGQFAEAFQDAFAGGAEEVVCFCVSSDISATYAAARAGKEMLPGQEITVVDTRTLTIAQGFTVLAAAEAVQDGASAEDAVARGLDVRDRCHVYAALSTLKYLAMSGRVPHLAAGVADLLNVKPILTVRDGTLDMLERVRTRRRAWKRLIDLANEAAAGRTIERMAIVQIVAAEDAAVFEEQLRAGVPCPEEILTVEMSPGMSVHGGAGFIGVAFVVA